MDQMTLVHNNQFSGRQTISVKAKNPTRPKVVDIVEKCLRRHPVADKQATYLPQDLWDI